jgi:hypothetical protein
VTDKEDALFLADPYIPSATNQTSNPPKFRRMLLDFLEKEVDRLFQKQKKSKAFNSLTDMIIGHYFKDLNQYYSDGIKDSNGNRVAVKTLIRQRLELVLKKHRSDRVLLIAHSMGSIIAYEVLCLLNQELEIDTLVTMGSPLGQPFVKNKFLTELEIQTSGRCKSSTPESVKGHWFNLSDLEDRIAVNYDLADDYSQNSQNIRVVDKQVYNDYLNNEKRNPHKSYGYLRTPEMARIVHQFLTADRNRLKFWFINQYLKIMRNLFKTKS